MALGLSAISNSIAKQKAQLRLDIKDKLKLLNPKARQGALDRQLVEFLKGKKGIWAAYMAIGYEPRVDAAIQALTNIEFAYPKIVGAELHFYLLGPKGFEPGARGILEPVLEHAKPVDIQEIAGFLVPGIAFDRSGFRLGRGAGYYDRALARANGVKVGITWSELILADLPREEHDIPMQILISDSTPLLIERGN